MSTAREIMTGGVECARTSDTLVDAARLMRDLEVGALPICGDDDRLAGMITDRDIVVHCVAEGGDPSSTRVESLAEGKPVTIGADDSLEETLRTMAEHQVRRLPVIDGHQLVGIVSQADVARNLPDELVGDLVSRDLLGAGHRLRQPNPTRRVASARRGRHRTPASPPTRSRIAAATASGAWVGAQWLTPLRLTSRRAHRRTDRSAGRPAC